MAKRPSRDRGRNGARNQPRDSARDPARDPARDQAGDREAQAGGQDDPTREVAPGTPEATDAGSGVRPAETPDSGTSTGDSMADDAAPRLTGRDDDLDGDLGGERPDAQAAARAGIADRTVPSLEGSPIGAEPAETPHAEDQHAAEHEEHHARSGFAATALKILIFVLVIFGLSLWLVPMVAPHLPAGLARVLMPGQAELDQQLAALGDRIESSTGQISADVAAMRQDIATLTERLGTVEQTAGSARTESEAARKSAEESAASAQTNVVAGETVSRAEAAAREASGLADTATTAATEAGKVASAAARDTASLARRMTDFDARLAALSDQIDAVNESLAGGGADGEAAAPELAAAFAAVKSEVESLKTQLGQADLVTETEAQRFATQDDLRSARTALEAEIGKAIARLPAPQQIVVEDQLNQLRQNAESKVSQVIDRVDTLEKTAAQAADTATAAEQAANTAVAKVDEAIRQASLRSAAAALTSRLENGVPYAGAMAEVASLQGTPPPAPLAAPAEAGVATTAELLRHFGQPAQAAIKADIEARAGSGLLAQASARVESVIAGRPASELPGDSVEAILSRVEARLRAGDPAAALAEAGTLPAPAQAALGPWLAELTARVAATQAAADWLGAAGKTSTVGG